MDAYSLKENPDCQGRSKEAFWLAKQTEVTPELRQQIAEVEKKLSNRKSVACVARGLALMVTGTISLGICCRLYLESKKLPLYFWLSCVLAVALFGGALVNLRNGWCQRRKERQWIREQQELLSRAGQM